MFRSRPGGLLAALALALVPATAQAITFGASAGPPLTAARPAQTVRGHIVSIVSSELTLQGIGAPTSVVGALTAAADRLGAADYPYVWGGGHAFAGTASVGERGGPGSNGRRLGFDCSGSVAAVLAGAGVWPAGAGVPGDSGIIATLRHERLIARGAGHGPRSVTLWDDPGVHIFMEIGESFFGTSDGGPSSPADPRGGPGWLDDGAPDITGHHFHPWHLLAAALAGRVSDGPIITVGLSPQQADTLGALQSGTPVSVRYAIRRHQLAALGVSTPER